MAEHPQLDQTAQRRLLFLAEAGRVLAASLDYEDTLQSLAELAVPTLGDLCLLDVVTEDGRLRRIATHHRDPHRTALVRQLMERYPPDADAPHPAARALRSGEAVLLADVTEDVIAAHTRDADHAALIRAVGLRSHLAVPLQARGSTLGVLSLGITDPGRRYGPEDLELAQELARRAALAVDNARLYRQARLSESRFRALFEQSPLSTQIFTPDGRPVRANRAWEELWGTALADIPDYNVLHDPQLVAKGIMPYIQKGFAGEATAIPVVAYNPNETLPGRTRYQDPTRHVRAFIYPVKDGAGRVTEVVLVHDDITAETRAKDALRESEERLRLALDAGNCGIWDWDVASDRVVWSERVYEFHGVAPGRFGGRVEDFTSLIHPDDRARVEGAIRTALEAVGPYQIEFRVVRPSGEVRWISTSGGVIRDAAGRPVRMLGATIDVTERRRAEEALKEADRRKDEFLAMLAHELRNPLAPIANAVQVLRVIGPDRLDLQRWRDVIERQAQHLSRLVDDLLDVSRITRGKIGLQTEPTELADVLARAVETSRPLLDARRHRLTFTPPPASLRLHADPTRLAQAVANLLHNAAKYTEEGGHITLAAGLENGRAVIRVRDTGVGIPADMLSRIFDLFAQVDRSLDRSQGGLGIGLTLVKNLVEMHGGTVRAHSDGPGKGSEFVVDLPALPETAPSANADGASRRRPVAARRVLVVDDNVDAAESLAALLRLNGHEVRSAGDGPEALEAAAAFRPEVVLLDIGLPRMDGYEVARKLRGLPDLGGALLVALTGYGQDEDRRRCLEAGFDRHLVKPVDPAFLQELLGSAGGDAADEQQRPAVGVADEGGRG